MSDAFPVDSAKIPVVEAFETLATTCRLKEIRLTDSTEGDAIVDSRAYVALIHSAKSLNTLYLTFKKSLSDEVMDAVFQCKNLINLALINSVHHSEEFVISSVIFVSA